MTEYVKVEWIHDNDVDPILFLSELGEDRYEIRKLQYYRNGRVEWADEAHETDSVGLSEVPFPKDLSIIDSQSEFIAEKIDAGEFSAAWLNRRPILDSSSVLNEEE